MPPTTTPKEPSPPALADGLAAPRSFALQVVVATTIVAVCPTLVVWLLRSSGVLKTYPLGAALGMALSLGAAYLGRAVWQTRPGSRDILFSDLMIWGYALRAYRQRRLRSARAVLGLTSQAQLKMPDGLSPERQVKLIESLAGALDARDAQTHGHSQRVARYAWIIASRMGLPAEQVARVRTAAAIHDIGKLHTPLSILRKPGRLTGGEFDVMKRHAATGAVMASALNDPAITAMVRHHHERLDGSGYPDALRGGDIPLGARIIAVADTFDAMTADRPYQRGRIHQEALAVLDADAGTKLDAEAVRAFRNHYSGRRAIAVWSSLTTVPSRIAEMLGASAGGFATAAKSAAVAALVGSFAAGTARITPTASHAPARVADHGLSGARSSNSSELSGAAGTRAAAIRAGGSHRTAGAGAHAPTHGASRPGSSLARGVTVANGGGQPQARDPAGNAEAPQGGSGSGTASPTLASSETTVGESKESGGKSKEVKPEEAKGKSEEAKSKSEGSHGKSEEAKGKSEETHGESEGSHGESEEAKGKSEEAHGKSEESRGKSEEVHGKAEKSKDKSEELSEKVKEAVGKVTETTGGVVEQTTGTVGKVLGKL